MRRWPCAQGVRRPPHPAASRARPRGDPPPSGQRRPAALARRPARDRRSGRRAPVLGIRVGRWARDRAVPARSPGGRGGPARVRPRVGVGAVCDRGDGRRGDRGHRRGHRSVLRGGDRARMPEAERAPGRGLRRDVLDEEPPTTSTSSSSATAAYEELLATRSAVAAPAHAIAGSRFHRRPGPALPAHRRPGRGRARRRGPDDTELEDLEYKRGRRVRLPRTDGSTDLSRAGG